MMRPGSPEHGSQQDARAAPKPIVPPKSFPHCIVWSPIPLVTWFIPFIGHMGEYSPLLCRCRPSSPTIQHESEFYIKYDTVPRCKAFLRR